MLFLKFSEKFFWEVFTESFSVNLSGKFFPEKFFQGSFKKKIS